MASLRSDSPVTRRIVLSFLDFLKSVEPAPGIDLEALDVARECLEEVFKLNISSSSDHIPPGLLIDLFTSWESAHQSKVKSDLGAAPMENVSSISSAARKNEDSNGLKASNTESQIGERHFIGGDLIDELFGRFYEALDKINFFKSSPTGIEDPAQVAKATDFFNDAVKDVESSQGQIVNLNNLAETLKLKGNQSMQLKKYIEAVELYTCAIALYERNAVYYSNRAAAYTQIHKYAEAVEDCSKSIEIDPSYSKAYSRLGLAYYAQGNYDDAINKGFMKALQLDPSNTSIRENIRVAQQKLMEQRQRAQANENTGSSQRWQSNTQSTGASNWSSTFTFPSNVSIPPDFTNFFRNMASTAQGQQTHETRPNGNSEEPEEPEIRMDANVGVGFAEIPEQISGALRSVLGMFSQEQGPQREMPGAGDPT